MDRGTDEEIYYKQMHLENNTFDDGDEAGNGLRGVWDQRERQDGDGGRESFIEGEQVRVVVVKIRDGRVSDWKGAVRDWSLGPVEEGNATEGLVNGVS